MMKNTIHMIKEINKGKNLTHNLPIYCASLTDLYAASSLLEVTMNAVTLYEMEEENLNPYLKDVKNTVDFIHQTIVAMYVEKQPAQNYLDRLDQERKQLMECMQILTTYIDRLQVYEYVMNRVEYRFTHTQVELAKREQSETLEEWLKQVANYIFHVKDNMVINENIREIMAQLPVRMTKARFFELLKQSLSVYQGAEKSSVENYIYMVRTAGMLFRTEGEEEYFTEFLPLLKELSSIDYRSITQEVFHVMMEKLTHASEKMHEITELYLVLQELINSLYAYAVSQAEYENTVAEDDMLSSVCQDILATIGRTLKAWDEGKNSEESTESVYEKLPLLEGKMEACFEERSHMEAVLEEIGISFLPTVKELGLEKTYERLEQMQKLLASSKFIELSEEECDAGLADSTYIGECADRLIAEFSELFTKSNRQVMRGIMAAVLGKMPVFFGSSQEVMDYIMQAMGACDNLEERFASMDLLTQMMEGAYDSMA